MLFDLSKLKKTYNGRTVLDLEQLSLDRGKIISVLGPNGAGKTTLLEIIAFLSSPSSGEVWFEQEKVDFAAGKLIHLRRKVALAEQQSILFTA
jgi:tungstate transport system ATP-binding protein